MVVGHFVSDGGWEPGTAQSGELNLITDLLRKTRNRLVSAWDENTSSRESRGRIDTPIAQFPNGTPTG